MNRVSEIEVELEHDPTPDDPERLQRAYDRIIELALRNLERRGVDKEHSSDN